MGFNSITARAAAGLPFIGIVLALANWNARPDRAWAWAVAIVVFVAMVVIVVFVRNSSPLASLRSSGDASSVRSLASVNGAVVWGALMMIIPLTVRLAQAYGIVDDPDSGRRATMIIIGAYVAATGNALPRMLPPVSAMPWNGTRVQAFQRTTGWMLVLCGLGFATAWLALPVDAAKLVSMSLVAAATIITIMQLLRLRKPQQHASGMN